MRSTFLSFLFLTVIVSPYVNAEPASGSVAVVRPAQFKVGNYWTWTYFGHLKSENHWRPYIRERYTVTEVDGPNVTLEMSSADYPGSAWTTHHRVIVDLRKCLRQATDPRAADFAVKFYKKADGPSWQLVSKAHPNLVFTEKFNCQAAFKHFRVALGEFIFKGVSTSTFRIQKVAAPSNGSFYFTSYSPLEGIVAEKHFAPRFEYRMELTDFGM